MPEVINTNRTVSPKEAKAAIRKCIKVGRPVLIRGAPGGGKSDIVHQIAAEQGREVIDVRLSLWEPTDIKGIPYYNPDLGGMAWAPPIELPTKPDSTAILFLDEINSAPQATQAAAYQLILNRRIGTYKLPDGVSIVAAGNREGDKGVTYRIPSPLANRFLHLELKVKFDDWFDWAVENGIHEQVVGYLNYSKHDLEGFDPKSNSLAFATPRSWSFVSDLLQDNDVSEGTLTDLVAGAIGDGLALKFMAHRKIAQNLPAPIEILNGKVKKLDIKEISVMYSLVISMCYELKEANDEKVKNWDELGNNFLRFMLDNFQTELIVMGMKIGLQQYKLPFNMSRMEHFKEFNKKYGDLILAAIGSN